MPKASAARTQIEDNLALIEEFRQQHEGQPFQIPDVTEWALATGRWVPTKRSLRRELSQQLSKAAKSARHTDEQGRKGIRSYHAVKFQKINDRGQKVFAAIWDYINSMSFEHGAASFQQRHGQLEGGCQSLYNDQCSFNDNNPHAAGNPIQLSFDFQMAVELQSSPAVEKIESSEAPENAKPKQKPKPR